MAPPLLAFDRVSKTYRRGRHENVVLDGVSFELAAGELAAVFGRRAAGKSTLLRIAAGLDAPDAGSVALNGSPLFRAGRRPRLGGLPSGVGWLQRSGPFTASMSVVDYVAMPLLETTSSRHARARALEALDRMAATRWADARWQTMSDGERTLAALARATVTEPSLLLADDPVSGLDTREREVVLGLLRDLAVTRGTTVLITVAALPDTLRAHRIMSLSDGELMQAARSHERSPTTRPHHRGGTA